MTKESDITIRIIKNGCLVGTYQAYIVPRVNDLIVYETNVYRVVLIWHFASNPRCIELHCFDYWKPVVKL